MLLGRFSSQRHEIYLYKLGQTVAKAIRVLLEHRIKTENIILLNLFATPNGVQTVTRQFPDLKILTSEIHPVAPNHFGQKYFGTDWGLETSGCMMTRMKTDRLGPFITTTSRRVNRDNLTAASPSFIDGRWIKRAVWLYRQILHQQLVGVCIEHSSNVALASPCHRDRGKTRFPIRSSDCHSHCSYQLIVISLPRSSEIFAIVSIISMNCGNRALRCTCYLISLFWLLYIILYTFC